MVKYVDSGFDDAPGGKKKIKKGFKCDRRENYQKMIARKLTGKNIKSTNTNHASAHVRSVTFDESSRREYLLTLHKKKNERRVQAFVESKWKLRRENAKTRQQQREEARLAYNSYAKVPILPNYTFGLNQPQEDRETDSAAGEEEEEEEEGEDSTASKRMAVREESTHAMPAAMYEGGAAASPEVFKDVATVEVKPLFPPPQGGGAAGSSRRPALPSADFSDLPTVVEEELHRLRCETKGPSRTKPKIHMLKELEKIRKIKKHSRKGHGKKTVSGKRKNRKK
ncbi:unnamed protein product [Phytomonas sp. EM1]|nr:unnamed protein product [Phytomonas sp. EM1]|eukprot:CCW60475.1 unnamed protein product [Phytomonas sp. isolate EM1]